MCKITIEMDESDPRFPSLLKLLSGSAPSTFGTATAAPAPSMAPAAMTSTPTTPMTNPPVTMPVAATAAPAPSPTPTTAGEGVTIDDVNKALQGAITRVKASGAKAILTTLGVAKAGDLRPDQYAAAIAALNG